MRKEVEHIETLLNGHSLSSEQEMVISHVKVQWVSFFDPSVHPNLLPARSLRLFITLLVQVISCIINKVYCGFTPVSSDRKPGMQTVADPVLYCEVPLGGSVRCLVQG